MGKLMPRHAFLILYGKRVQLLGTELYSLPHSRDFSKLLCQRNMYTEIDFFDYGDSNAIGILKLTTYLLGCKINKINRAQ